MRPGSTASRSSSRSRACSSLRDNTPLRVHLLDGTYELFRHYFAVPKVQDRRGREVGAIRGVLSSVLSMLEDGVTHLAVATDHVVESFRNDLWPGYKSSEGMDPEILEQFHPLEDALRSLGLTVFAMTDLEADDALASAAAKAATDPRVEQVLVCSPDKDMAQCVAKKRVVQFDRRKRELRDEEGVVRRFGVLPASIPDYLALVGDASDGFPGLPGWGPKSASLVLAKFGHIRLVPDRSEDWGLPIRGPERLAKTLRERRHLADLFRRLATLSTDLLLFETIEELEWKGPSTKFRDLCSNLSSPELADRADALRRSLSKS